VAEEYRSQTEIKIGQNVDFQAEADNATAIYLLKGELAGIASESLDKLTQSAKALAGSESVSKGAESVKQFLFKPFVLPIAGITFLVIVFFAFFRGDGLAGSTFSGYAVQPFSNNEVSVSIKFKPEGKLQTESFNIEQDGTYEIEGNSVKVKIGSQIYRYIRDGNTLTLNNGKSVVSVLKKN
jgi:hypothetical protein